MAYMIEMDNQSGLIKIVEKQGTTGKLVGTFATLGDMILAMSSNMVYKTPYLPNAFLYSADNGAHKIYMMHPARRMKYKISDGSRSGGFVEKDIYIPNTVIIVYLVDQAAHFALNKTKIFFTDSPFPFPNAKLYKPPFSNIFDDCGVCFGGVRVGPWPKENLYGISSIYDMFFGNVANNDLFKHIEFRHDGTRYEFTSIYDLASFLHKAEPDVANKLYFTQDKLVGFLSTY